MVGKLWGACAILSTLQQSLETGQRLALAPSRQLPLQAFFTARHGPAMVRGKYGLEQKGEIAQQRLIGCEPPIKGGIHKAAVLLQCPDANAIEIPGCCDGQSARGLGLGATGFPA